MESVGAPIAVWMLSTDQTLGPPSCHLVFLQWLLTDGFYYFIGPVLAEQGQQAQQGLHRRKRCWDSLPEATGTACPKLILVRCGPFLADDQETQARGT